MRALLPLLVLAACRPTAEPPSDPRPPSGDLGPHGADRGDVDAPDAPPGAALLPLPVDGPPRTTFQAAWGELDGASPPEVAVANTLLPVEVLRWQGGRLAVVWRAPFADSSQGVAWGDVDGDGDPDLAVGREGPVLVLRNDGGVLVPAWHTPDEDFTEAVALGDADGDGALELLVGNRHGEVDPTPTRPSGGALRLYRFPRK